MAEFMSDGVRCRKSVVLHHSTARRLVTHSTKFSEAERLTLGVVTVGVAADVLSETYMIK